MAYDIRPLSFAEVLDRAFRVYIDNFALLAGISLAIWIPNGVLNAVGHFASILALIVLLVGAPIMGVAQAIAVAHVYLDRPISVQDAYQATRPILLQVIGTYLLFGLLLGAPIGALMLLMFKLGRTGALLIPVMIVAFCAAVFFANRWALTLPVMVVEKRFGFSGLNRSGELVNQVWWPTLGILFVAGLLVSVPGGALQFFWKFVPIVGPILNAATQAITSTYSAVVLVVYYFDRRCRVENFDLRLLAEQVRAEGGASAPVMSAGANPVA